MVKTTRKQREALFKLFQRDFPSWISPGKRWSGSILTGTYDVPTPTIQWRRFRKKVCGYPDGSGCVMVEWKGMWVGVETDGYTHT